MTDDQHREIGRILGFPDCCVEAWIASPSCELAKRNGGRTERVRSLAEAQRLDAQVSVLLGRPWRGCQGDRRKHYVMCDACAAATRQVA